MSEGELKAAITKANQEIEEKQREVASTPFRLQYHFMPPVGWMNDPNGFIQYNCEYHLFYQYYPYESTWGPMHWGHAKSKDLVRWEHLPVALAPSETYDKGNVDDHGCFSGSAVEKDNELFLVYTGHSIERDPMQVQCIATSKDGFTFKKFDGNPVINEVPNDGSKDFRDPKVWNYQGKWNMVVGSKKDGKGKAIYYQSDNLKDWIYRGAVAESDGTQGDMWECPDLFPFGDDHALIVSPMYGDKNEKPFIILGEMDYDKGVFTQGKSTTLDYGYDFYAPQTLIDDRGRRVMISWMEMWFSHRPSETDGWAGAMTVPRELVLSSEGRILQKPVAEFADLRKNHQKLESFYFTETTSIKALEQHVAEIMIDFNLDQTDASVFGLQLRCSEDKTERTEITVDLNSQEIVMNRNYSGTGEKGVSKAPFKPTKDNKLSLRLFLDTTSIELFINGGEQVITNRIYPELENKGFHLFAEGGKVKVERIEFWEMSSIWGGA